MFRIIRRPHEMHGTAGRELNRTPLDAERIMYPHLYDIPFYSAKANKRQNMILDQIPLRDNTFGINAIGRKENVGFVPLRHVRACTLLCT